MNKNAKKQFRFSGLAEVTKILPNPYETAAAAARPITADLPLPLGEVRITVE